MRILLHIGSPKTGTTSLQDALIKNHDQLIESGVLYPKAGTAINHNRLSLLFRNDPPAREFLQNSALTRADYVLQAKQLLASIQRQARHHRAHTLVLSGEYFFYELTPEQGSQLKERFLTIADSVEIVAYLRPPADYYKSIAIQIFKASSVANRPTASPYLRILESYERDFKVTVRPYSRSELASGDIVTDFCSRFLPELKEPINSHPLNESISAEGLYLLNLHRDQIFPGRDNTFYDAGRRLYAVLQRIEREAGLRATPVLKTWVRKVIEDGFKESRAKLGERYGVFFPEEPFDVEPSTPLGVGVRPRVEDVFEIDKDRLNQITVALMSELVARKVRT